MKALIAAIHYPVASGRYAADALRRLGHDVKTVGPTTGTRIWNTDVDPRYVWTPDLPADDWTPDLVIIMEPGPGLVPEFLGWTQNLPHMVTCPIVVWGVDNHVRNYGEYPFADHLFLAHGHGHRIGEPDVTHLPCAYDPVWFTPGPAWSEREFDAAMIGVQYGNRSELLYALRTHVKGDWTCLYGTGPVYAEYAQTYQRSRISIVRSAEGDVAIRVWETAAMGCLVLKDANHDDAVLGLVDGGNCLIYHTLDEAAQKLRWALDNPAGAEAVAQRGQAWAAAGTWDARAQEVIDWAAKRQKAVKKHA